MTKNTRLSGLVMDMRQGEVVALGHNIKIHFLEKSGRITRVRIAAPLDVKIRKESEKARNADMQHKDRLSDEERKARRLESARKYREANREKTREATRLSQAKRRLDPEVRERDKLLRAT